MCSLRSFWISGSFSTLPFALLPLLLGLWGVPVILDRVASRSSEGLLDGECTDFALASLDRWGDCLGDPREGLVYTLGLTRLEGDPGEGVCTGVRREVLGVA